MPVGKLGWPGAQNTLSLLGPDGTEALSIPLWRPLGRAVAEADGDPKEISVLRVPVQAPDDRPLRLSAFILR